VLTELAINPSTVVELGGKLRPIVDVLTRRSELTRLSMETIRSYSDHSGGVALKRKLESFDGDQFKAFIGQRQFIDLVKEFPARLQAQELAHLLRPLSPRSYSLASSQSSVGEEAHLTVSSRYSNATGELRRGVASTYLNERLRPGDELGVFIEPNSRFRLPENHTTPVIMIAAGTGIAPYRSFLQQLEEEGANPETWLIFGNPHLQTDFLYQREWLGWRKQGLLNYIDGAFSRDQDKKRYVQDVVREQAAKIDDWLERGATIYLCGSTEMGQEVELALKEGMALNRGLDTEEVAEIFADLRRTRRLLKDLY